MAVFIGGIGATNTKKKLILYRFAAADSKGRKFYKTSKGDVYYYDKKNQLYSFDYDENGKEMGISVRNSRVDVKLMK
jgi:hypothetical protein